MADLKKVTAVLVVSAAGLLATATREGGFVKKAYLDPVKIPTICAGHTKGVQLGQTATESTCALLLQQDTKEAQDDVRKLVRVPVTQRQYDELVDFVFNVGGTNFASSTLLKKINAGDCKGAGAEFPKWKYAKGIELQGLVNRRAMNRAGWESGC